ncbi:hypothetical protein [Brevibacillus sp. NRS-1366]|uniref:hypothetical protein n=1 Tax=Brevibacillus sp. NRS-1366 TaxID=3233899 RepID=UPI003D2282EB
MDTALFFLFSTIEYMVIFYLLITLFRRKFIEYLGSSIYISMGLSLLSYVLRFDLNLENVAIIVQMLFFISSICIVWKVQWFYAGIMTIISYSTYLVIQGFCVLILKVTGIIELVSFLDKQNHSVTLIGYVLQGASVILCLLICLFIKKFGYGWSFVPDGEGDVKYSEPTNKAFLLIMVCTTAAFGSIAYLSGMGNIIFFVVVLLLSASVLGLFFHITNKRELKEND